MSEQGRGISIGLGILQVFVGLGGVYGGIGLISDPRGPNIGIPLESLEGTPFTDLLIPGIILLCLNGLGQLTGAVMSFWRIRFAGEVAAILGAGLVIWLAAQFFWLGFNWFQPPFLVVGLVEICLGFLLRRAPARGA